MTDVLLLLTDVFPFAKGEEFLETELPHLSSTFERVVVVATKTSSGDVQTRAVPDNVTVLRAGGQVSGRRADQAKLAWRGLGAIRGRQVRATKGHPGKLAVEALFEARARRAVDDLAGRLEPALLAGGEPSRTRVVIYSYWFHTSARVAVLVAEQLRRAGFEVAGLVSRAHRFDLYPEESPFGHLAQRESLLEAFDAVHPVSDQGTQLLQRLHPRHAHKVSTRRLGTTDPGAQVESRQQPFHVVSCSFISPVKRVDRFPAVLAALAELGVDVRWTHFGSGDGLEQVQAEADRLLGPGRAKLVGYVANRELPQRYRDLNASALVNLSSSEGVPVTIMEATSLGMPVVATNVGGVGEIVRGGTNGYLLPADFADAEAAIKLARLAQAEPDEYHAMGRRSREVWDGDFNAERVYPAWAEELMALGR